MIVFTARPRILIRGQAGIAALQAKALPTNDRWQTLLTLASGPASWDVGILAPALCYLLTGDPSFAAKAWDLMTQSMAAGTAQVSSHLLLPMSHPLIAAEAEAHPEREWINIPTGIKEVSGDSGYQARNYFLAASAVLDWCSPVLTVVERQTLVADIEACADWVYPRTNPARVGMWGVEAYGNNYHAGFQYTWLAGLALYGDSAKAQGYVDEGLRRWNSNVLPYLNTTAAGGVLFEGSSYSTDYLGMTLLQLLAHSTATDQDLLTSQLNPGWCHDAIYAMIHQTAPSLAEIIPDGDQTKSSSGALSDSHRIPMLVAWENNANLDALGWLNATKPSRCQQRLNAAIEFLLGPPS